MLFGTTTSWIMPLGTWVVHRQAKSPYWFVNLKPNTRRIGTSYCHLTGHSDNFAAKNTFIEFQSKKSFKLRWTNNMRILHVNL